VAGLSARGSHVARTDARKATKHTGPPGGPSVKPVTGAAEERARRGPRRRAERRSGGRAGDPRRRQDHTRAVVLEEIPALDHSHARGLGGPLRNLVVGLHALSSFGSGESGGGAGL